MKTKTTSVKVTRTINASPQEIFDSVQHECRLREWMCDGARTVPRKGGLFHVWWNSGYEARGVFATYSPPRARTIAHPFAQATLVLERVKDFLRRCVDRAG